MKGMGLTKSYLTEMDITGFLGGLLCDEWTGRVTTHGPICDANDYVFIYEEINSFNQR
jgi:hypothetical protein